MGRRSYRGEVSGDRSIYVTELAVSPVKGLRLVSRAEVWLERSGVRDDRRFFLIDERSRMVNGKQLGALSAVVADYQHDDRRLQLTFPTGARVSAEVVLGVPVDVRFFSRPAQGRLVLGPWSEALSEHVGQPIRLVETLTSGRAGVDRGRAGAVSLISRGSLARLSEAAGEPRVDARRFRMLTQVDGIAAHAEDAWVGKRVRVGTALVGMRGHVGRCLVVTRHPETGRVDLPALDVLRGYRGHLDTTEPLAFGIYGEVLEPGVTRVGDRVVVGS